MARLTDAWVIKIDGTGRGTYYLEHTDGYICAVTRRYRIFTKEAARKHLRVIHEETGHTGRVIAAPKEKSS